MLVDTSVWIDHFHQHNTRLASSLEQVDVSCHDFVLGELACGNLRKRDETLGLLGALPRLPIATHNEAVALLDSAELMGKGLGWVDVHLLAAARLAGEMLWTLDRRLALAAEQLGLTAR